jgi:hypothetical protein
MKEYDDTTEREPLLAPRRTIDPSSLGHVGSHRDANATEKLNRLAIESTSSTCSLKCLAKSKCNW